MDKRGDGGGGLDWGDGGGDVGCGDGSRSDDGAGCGDDSRGGDDDDDSGVEMVVEMVAAGEVVMEMWCRMVVAAKVVAVVWQRGKLMVTDDMVKYVLEKYEKNWKVEDEIVDVILEDLWIRYGKDDKGKGKVEKDLARANQAEQTKQAGDDVNLVDVDDVDLFASLDLENIAKTLEEDFTRLLKAKKAK
ncbi:hypothetical protein Tco_1256785 [Tanacetum coccineum]